MNKWLVAIAFSVLLLIPLSSHNAFAVTIPITNPSFEDPPLALGTFSNTAPGWTLSDSIVRHGFPTATDGSNVLVIEQIVPSDIESGTATQVVTTVAPDTRYILTFDLLASPFANGVGFVFFFVNGGFQGGDQVESGTIFPGFTTESVSWDSPSSGPLIGEPLEISFGGFAIATGPADGIFYDNIRLEAIDLNTLDDDGDTVPNPIDLCPGEDDLLDTDGDGIPDCLDPEPNLGCGPGTSQVGTLCLPDQSGAFDCGPKTEPIAGICVPKLDEICSTGTIIEPTQMMTCIAQAAGLMIGGAILEINSVSLLVGSIGVNPVITALVGITIAGVAGQAVWFVHRRRNRK